MRSGFTLIELLIVIVITAIIVAAAVPIYGDLQGDTLLTDSTSEILQSIRSTQRRANARVNNAAHGVFFEINPGDDRVIAYQGDSYATRDATYDREIIVNGSMTLSTTLSGNEVNFSRGLGEPDNTGDIAITHDNGDSSNISINSLGKIESN